MSKKEILLALTAGSNIALGNIWRITAKGNDFYLDPLGTTETVHLSLHGPRGDFSGHRFHIKVDRKALRTPDANRFFLSGVPRKGYSFDGAEVSPRAFLVARIRWTWHLQRPMYRSVAASRPTFDLAGHQTGAAVDVKIGRKHSWDVDLIVSYDEPFWPDAAGSARDNARLGPLSNAAGMWLTATSYRRPLRGVPTPQELALPLPLRSERPNRIMAGGFGAAGRSGPYWFVESITSRELLEMAQKR